MYKFFSILVVVLLCVTACKSSHKKRHISPTKAKDQAIVSTQSNYSISLKNPLLIRYEDFLVGLNTSAMESSIMAVQEYKSLFKAAAPATCDTAYFLFDRYYKKLSDTIDAIHDRDTSIQYDSLLVDTNDHRFGSISAKTADYAQRLAKSGFRVIMSEGDTYIIPDLDFEVANLKSYLSIPIQAFLVQVAREDKEGFAEDAGLTITPKQLVNRTVWWERYIDKNPGLIVSPDARGNYKDDLSVLLQGMDNSPVLAYDSHLDDYFRKAYELLQKDYPSSRTNRLVGPYFKNLAKSDTAAANALLKSYRKTGLLDDTF